MKIKNKFNKEGYIKIDTDIKSNPKFAYISKKFDFFLNKEINKESSKKLGGYIMCNLSMQQGYLGNILFKLLFTSKFVSKIESLVENKLTEYDIFFGGNICLPNKGDQIFHTDGAFKKEMYLISVATQEINIENGPTEICEGSSLKRVNFWDFYFSKKKINKLLMKKGDVLIRKHSLWHRGTKNKSSEPRMLINFALTPKKKIKQRLINSNKFKLLPNFFKNNFKERINEIIYTYFPILVIANKLIRLKLNLFR